MCFNCNFTKLYAYDTVIDMETPNGNSIAI